MTQPEGLKRLLDAVALGQVSPEDALDKLKHFSYQTVDDFARVDHHRSLRTGFPEVIWGQDKTPDQIVRIMTAMQDATDRLVPDRLAPDRLAPDRSTTAPTPDRSTLIMATRVQPEVYRQIHASLPDANYYPMARICTLKRPDSAAIQAFIPHSGTIALLSAGTADLPVAEEAAVTAELCGFTVQRLWDVGVAGIHRLLDNRWAIDTADVLIVVAGMEGALPSVVAGLADCPVIAVPTSVGYGASFNGLAALLTMLNSCAAGIGVVNIDNGFGAAMLAGQILRTANRLRSHPSR